MHQCNYCSYQSSRKYNLKVHERNKHGGYGESYRAPTTVSVPPSQQVTSIQPQQRNIPYKCRHCNFQHAYDWVVYQHMYEQHSEYYPSAFTSKQENGAPTTMSIPPLRRDVLGASGLRNRAHVQKGYGVDIDDDDSSDMEEVDEEDMYDPRIKIWDEPRGDEEREFCEIANDLRDALHYITDLREEFRKALPQLKRLEGKEMKTAVKTYAWLEAAVQNEQNGLEDTSQNEFEDIDAKTDSDSDSDGDEEEEEDMEEGYEPDTDSDADTEEEEECDAEAVGDSEEEEKDEEEDTTNNEQFWDFVYEARLFIDDKILLEKHMKRARFGARYLNEIEIDKTDNPKDIKEIIEDVANVYKKFKTDGDDCFKTCSKRKIYSLCNISHCLLEADAAQKLEDYNPSQYKRIVKMMGPHLKSLKKLTDSTVSTHEKRKTIQKSQVGEGILKTAFKLVFSALSR